MTGKRRLVVAVIFGVLVLPHVAAAQPAAQAPRIGYLSALPQARVHEVFRQSLREHGYVEGQNVVIEYRWAERPDQFPDLAAELVSLKVNLIVGVATLGAHAAKDSTSTIPIVMVGAGDPVATGLVESLARPGGNVTGVSSLATDLAAKRLELLKELLPRLSRIAILWNSANLAMSLRHRQALAAARGMGLTLHSMAVRDPADFEAAFATMARERPDALLMTADTFTFRHRKLILDLTAKQRVPAMYEVRDFVDEGGLMSYGASLPEMFKRAAGYVDKILKGAKPAQLPVEQPTQFEFVINLKTARTLGRTVPQSLLLRATNVILVDTKAH